MPCTRVVENAGEVLISALSQATSEVFKGGELGIFFALLVDHLYIFAHWIGVVLVEDRRLNVVFTGQILAFFQNHIIPAPDTAHINN